jgi:hypothetical protein
MTSALKNTSSSEDEEASERDPENFENWIVEAGDAEDSIIPHASTFQLFNLSQPPTPTTNNQAEAAPTPNDVGISIQPPAASGITATNNETADCPSTLSTSNCIHHHRSSNASRQSSGSGKSEEETKNSSNKQ